MGTHGHETRDDGSDVRLSGGLAECRHPFERGLEEPRSAGEAIMRRSVSCEKHHLKMPNPRGDDPVGVARHGERAAIRAQTDAFAVGLDCGQHQRRQFGMRERLHSHEPNVWPGTVLPRISQVSDGASDDIRRHERALGSESAENARGDGALTYFDLDELVHAALRAGASGFLLKDAPADELFRAVRAIAAGDALIAPSVTRRLLDHFADSAPSTASTAAVRAVETLTGREREVLQLIARGRSNQEIAAMMFVAETTVKTHVGRIFMKLPARDRIQAAVIAYDAGLVVPGAD